MTNILQLTSKDLNMINRPVFSIGTIVCLRTQEHPSICIRLVSILIMKKLILPSFLSY